MASRWGTGCWNGLAGGVGAGEDTAAVEGDLLVDAFVANQHRWPLSLVEQARAGRRLNVDHGFTVNGIAQKLQLKQARVKEPGVARAARGVVATERRG